MSAVIYDTATIVIPIGLLISICVSLFAVIKSAMASAKTDTALKDVIGRQGECQNCLGVLRDNSIKQTTILEAIRDNTKR